MIPMTKRSTIAWTFAMALLTIAGLAAAQDTGTVEGTVTDLGGDPLPGVTVTVQGTDQFGVTDVDGIYSISAVASGPQVVNAQLSGFKKGELEVDVPSGGSATADFTLELDVLSMDQIVVTGAISPYSKLESSVAVTTQTAEEIEKQAPQSTADLLEVIPGFWVEDSGGEGGNNLFARGIPADGSFRYVAMHEDGLPVYESPELAFTNVDLLFRVDETVQAMEAVRGGTSSIFASNAPGGIINFVNKTGGDVPEGTIKLTVGDYNLFRADATYGGPIGENWRFFFGGFYRFDEGIRDPGFPANRGGQIKANVTRMFDNGYARISGKQMNERNIFYLPIPLQNPGDPTSLPGFDANFGTLTTNDASLVQLPTPDGQTLQRNLKDGMNPELTSVTGELFLELENGWTFKDTARFMETDVTFNAIFSLFNPTDAVLFGENQLGRVPGATDFRYGYTHFPNDAFDPANANGNGLVVESGWWTVQKPLENFVNDLRFTKQFDRHAFTAGFYFSSYEADETWMFNNVLLDVSDEARLLDLELLDAQGDVITSVTDQGFTRFGDFHRNATSDAFLGALYLSDEWDATDRLRIDLGVRYEKANFNGATEELGEFDLGDPTTLADDSVVWGTDNFLPYDFDFDELAGSIGLNYSLNTGLAIYGRVSEGFRMPDFDAWTDGNVNERGNVEDVFQLEGGVKYSSPKVGLFAALFFSEFDDVVFTDEILDPETGRLVNARRFASTETLGLEVEVIAEIVRNFRIGFTGTFQQPEFQDFQFTRGGETFDFSGNQVRRIPEILATIRPTYSAGPFTLYGAYSFVDDRFSDDANNTVLPSYDVLDAGVSYEVNSRLSLQLNGSNLTNSVGLTEGNPRVGQIIGVTQDIFMARPILGRAFRLAAKLRF